MSGERGGGHPSNYYAKEWDPVFSRDRNFIEDRSYVDYKRGIDADGDEFGIFFQDSEDSVPSCKVEEVKEFCQAARLVDLKSRAGTAGQRRAAWLDDRSSARLMTSRAREYENLLTAAALYEHLKEPRFNNSDKPDADRRLIYIADLDPYYILALTETASFHQVSVLRDAIWKYLACQTSIRVKIPYRGYPIFQMEFHISYFALRASSPKDPSRIIGNINPPRQWTDLSFLKIQPPKSQDQREYGMHEAQISVVICGSDNWRWAGYAFIDTSFEGEDLGDGIFSYEDVHEDPIASNSELHANLPIWDPREYFLTILEIRMTQVRKELEYLVRTVERSVKQNRNWDSSTLSQHPRTAGDRAEDIKKTFDWTQQIIELLSRVLGVLSGDIKCWERFKSPNGDIGYFSDIDSSPDASHRRRTRLSLRAINETFETLEGLQQKLLLLDKSCRNSAQDLQLRLTLESNEVAQQNGVTTELTVSILSPVALTIAYFSMPQAVIPFKLDSKSFIVTTFTIMVVVRLLFVVIRALLRQPWWWKKITAWMKKLQLDEMAHSRLALRRGRIYPDRSTDDIEMDTLGV
ncbi:hypothetical protein M430DRAFT_16661 [Amorphotheca resinae ATCC 22711]|uniref:Uncharacterized protein n=1 Tax=Amorphotheca resinae ATCC 22711 TaxID=857342 RepID=A0A2T3B790_AMORE|nr:hypothetical protein M430DRAFT_16661 [Amorphotheca resinae ATCC 22711]PSS22711.1 hypothetical protein M430DRAFT_16661 [Amorphotheca resinae ATCC 22711]